MNFQPYDLVSFDGRAAIVLFLWPDRVLARIRFNDTGQKRSVLVSELARIPELERAS